MGWPNNYDETVNLNSTSAAAPFSLNSASGINVTLTTNTTLAAPTNMVPGKTYQFAFTNSGGNYYPIFSNAIYENIGVPKGADGKTIVLRLHYTGTKFILENSSGWAGILEPNELSDLYQLSLLRKALLKTQQKTANTRILVLGGILASGSTLSPDDTNGRANSWPVLLAKRLSEVGLVGNANNYFDLDAKTTTSYTIHHPEVVFGAGWAGTSTQRRLSGGVTTENATTTNPIAITFTGYTFDTIEVVYKCDTTKGTLHLNVDGGASLGTINQAQTDTGAAGTNGMHYKKTYTVARGTHVINVIRDTGTVNDLSVTVWDSTIKSVDIMIASNYTYTWTTTPSTDLAALAAPVTPILPVYAPDLTIINHSFSDANRNTSISTFKTDMQKIITAAKLTGDVLLMSEVPADVSRATLANQTNMANALNDLAITNNIRYVNIYKKWQGDYTAMNTLGLMVSLQNPNNLGQQDIANSVFNAITSVI